MTMWANYNQDYIRSRSIETENGCWEWTRSITKDGYGQAGHPTEKRAHRLSWNIFKGEIPMFDIVCHKCDNRRCVNPDHLFLGSHRDNLQDAVNKGRIDLKARSALGRAGHLHRVT
jgi:hypothetical protein